MIMKLSAAVSAFLLRSVLFVANADCQSGDGLKFQQQLTPLLSEKAVVSFPFSPGWDELAVRASTPRVAPDFIAVVEVATEEDVQNTVSELALRLTHDAHAQLNRLKLRISLNFPSWPSLVPTAGPLR